MVVVQGRCQSDLSVCVLYRVGVCCAGYVLVRVG